MRLTDLFGARVLDRDGVFVGQVHDVRLTREPVGDVGERLSVRGVLVGLGAIGVRLGYVSGSTRGPWPLRKSFAHIARDAKYVPWETIMSRGPRELRLTVTVDDLEDLAELDDLDPGDDAGDTAVTDGLALLGGWLQWFALVAVLAWVVFRRT